jgi:hypothetical protein
MREQELADRMEMERRKKEAENKKKRLENQLKLNKAKEELTKLEAEKKEAVLFLRNLRLILFSSPQESMPLISNMKTAKIGNLNNIKSIWKREEISFLRNLEQFGRAQK